MSNSPFLCVFVHLNFVENIYRQILKKYWGFDNFRPLQEDIIRSVAQGNDTLGLLPTGGGKSITFQVPALAMEGICLVVTPLIALMKDQVENLKRRGIKAAAIHSGLTGRELQVTLDNCIYGNYKFLYLSPERLSTTLFHDKLPHLKVNMLAIDEAHCISQWGYDFRPSYLKIAEIREALPEVPVLALTATATPQVAVDIQNQLLFKKPNLFKKSFERPNLAYVVRRAEDKSKELLRILNSVPGTAIVYVRNRKKTHEYAEFLTSNGISADYYHAGLSPGVKDARQDRWMRGLCRVIVSTNAFGMGIDKPDVRVVVHMDVPDSLEAYFQEAGRAGRDGHKAFAVLLWSDNDKKQLNRSVTTSFPEPYTIRRVYEALGNFFQVAVGFGENQMFDFNIGKFCSAYKFNILTVFNSLKILTRAGYLDFSEQTNIPSKLMMLMDNFELYDFQDSHPHLAPLIKTLLRSYTGLFTEYATIDEETLAKRLEATRDAVYEQLQLLSKLRVLHYIPQRKTPLVTFLRRREEARHVQFAPMVYKTRLEQYRKRVDAVLAYATTSHLCRSKLLLRYFGQNDGNYCGHCDVCIDRRKSSLSDDLFQTIEQQVKVILQKKSLTASQLVTQLRFAEADVWRVLHWLEEVGLITENDAGTMEWCVRD